MGKKQHQKDKLYLTATEWSHIYGGKTSGQDLQKELLQKFKRLPFGHCCLSLLPYENSYCNKDGYVFELENLIKFVKKFKKDPISGENTEIKNFYKINISKNKKGVYQCPILFKEFNENSHIVVIKSTGNVYSFEAIQELVLKPKSFKDLINDQPFDKKDIITLQEPSNNLQKQNISKFYYQQNNLKWDDVSEIKNMKETNLKTVNQIMQATLNEIKTLEIPEITNDLKNENKTLLDRFNTANYSTGKVAAASTSTCAEPIAKLEAVFIGDDNFKYSQVNKKGYVQIITNLGNLNFELFCNQVPKACDNFIKLCKKNYYNNTKFHRLIKYFMVQGGDPTGTGKGGESIWGKPFEDEILNNLSHDKRGILSMANCGKNTNKSQFFITFKSCKHLDKKHTIFGRLVGGAEILDKIEQIPTSQKNDKPSEDIIIMKTIVFVDPFEEIEKKIKEERLKNTETTTMKKDFSGVKTVKRVGAFINLDKIKLNSFDDDDDLQVSNNKKMKKS